MADSRFFSASGPLTLAQLCEISGARLRDPAHGSREIWAVAPLDDADERAVAFIVSEKRRDDLQNTLAGACFAPEALAGLAPSHCTVLITDRPQYAWAVAAQRLHPVIHDAPVETFVHPTATLEDGVVIAPGVVIGAHATIGAGTRLEPHAVIGRGVCIGRDGYIGPQATVSFALLGDRVSIGPGVRIGQGGFGVTAGPKGPMDIPQLGRVIIQDGVSISANCCIDRGAFDDTVIGENSKLDNLVHIAHNVRIGRGCLIAGQVGISGSSVIGDGVVFGGQGGVADHLVIGDRASIGGGAGVLKNVPAGEVWSGTPARPLKQWLKETAAVSRLVKSKDGLRKQDR